MVRPFPNLHVASTLPLLIFLNYYLLKPIFHPGHPRPRPVTLLGHHPRLLPVGCLSVLNFSALALLLSVLVLLPRSPCPRIQKSCLCLSAQPFIGNFIYQSEATRGKEPSVSYVQILMQFRELTALCVSSLRNTQKSAGRWCHNTF